MGRVGEVHGAVGCHDAGDVREPGGLLPAVDVVGGAAEVERSRRPVPGDAKCLPEPLRDLVPAREVPAGPAGNQRQLDPLATGDAVHDLVHGPVAPDDH